MISLSQNRYIDKDYQHQHSNQQYFDFMHYNYMGATK